MNNLRLSYEDICKEFFQLVKTWPFTKLYSIVVEKPGFIQFKKDIGEWKEHEQKCIRENIYSENVSTSWKIVETEKYIWFSKCTTYSILAVTKKRCYPRHEKFLLRLSKKTGSLLNVLQRKYITFQYLGSHSEILFAAKFLYSLHKDTEWIKDHDLFNLSDKNLFRKFKSFRDYLQFYNDEKAILPIKELRSFSLVDSIQLIINSKNWSNPEFFIQHCKNLSLAIDYIRMYGLLNPNGPKPKYNKNIRKAHDSILKEFLLRKLSLDKVTIKLHSKFDPIFLLPKKYIPLLSKYDLELEGQIQRHCVGGYFNGISIGQYAIISAMTQEGRYTIQLESFVVDRTYKYRFLQIKGFANKLPSKEVITEIVQDFKKAYKTHNKSSLPITLEKT